LVERGCEKNSLHIMLSLLGGGGGIRKAIMCGRTRKTGKNRKWKLKVGKWIKEELRVHEEKSTANRRRVEKYF
jgi:hypothetical protein